MPTQNGAKHRGRAAIALVIGLTFTSPALAQQMTCRDLADVIVQQATTDVLADAVKKNPSLKELDEGELAKVAGKTFLGAERPDFKAYGFMMLLWYGGDEGRSIAAQGAADLQTEEERAHFFFVQGLFQLRSPKAGSAAQGRDVVRQVRDSGKVTFVEDAMWDQLINQCQLPP